MAVHHFQAPDMIVARGWQPMETFPRDGTMVEVIDAGGNINMAQWMPDVNRVASQSLAEPLQWRFPE